MPQQIWVKQSNRHVVRWQKVMSPEKLDLRAHHLLSSACPRSCDQMLPGMSQSWTSTAQGVKSTPERARGLGAGLPLEVTCFQNIKMMKMYEDPRSDKAFPGMLPTAQANSWALSPGALFHVFGLIRDCVRGNRRHIYQSAFALLSSFHRQSRWHCLWLSLPNILKFKKGSYLLTHFLSHFIIYHLICFFGKLS